MSRLIPFDQMPFHPMSEELVKIFCARTQNTNPQFFRVMTVYYWSLMASHLRCSIEGYQKGGIPINTYALSLSPSGTGKGVSTGMMENIVLKTFQDNLRTRTFEYAAEESIKKMASSRAARTGESEDDCMAKLWKEYHSLGGIPFSFDSATVPAIKQLRQKLNIANVGGLNLQVDEIALNFVQSMEVLTAYLELYDKGDIKEKLIKSTAENHRAEVIRGSTPTNMLLFGTGSKLLDGDALQANLMSMFEMGYARRCIFSFTRESVKAKVGSVDDLFDTMYNIVDDDFLEDLQARFGAIASPANINQCVMIEPDEVKAILEYRLNCESRGHLMKETDAILKAEMDHRYFKVLKISGAYAFIDESPTIEMEHIYYAIRLVEESGKDFARIMQIEPNYEKLAQYLVNRGSECTYPDIEQDCIFFRGGKAQREELVTMATAYAYKQGWVITKNYVNSVLFLQGEKLTETSLDELSIAASQDLAADYEPMKLSWDDLVLHLGQGRMQEEDGTLFIPDCPVNFTTHTFEENYRLSRNVIEGFNLIVLDVDDGTPLNITRELLKDYQYCIYTTKRHTEEFNRYRVIMPINYCLELDEQSYKDMLVALAQDLPFDIDTQSTERARKFLTNPHGECYSNEGKLMNVLPYIPKTAAYDERKLQVQSQENLDQLERWVINHSGDGNRNDMLLRFSLMLVDGGYEIISVMDKCRALNSKTQSPLSEDELSRTIFKTVAKRYQVTV